MVSMKKMVWFVPAVLSSTFVNAHAFAWSLMQRSIRTLKPWQGFGTILGNVFKSVGIGCQGVLTVVLSPVIVLASAVLSFAGFLFKSESFAKYALSKSYTKASWYKKCLNPFISNVAVRAEESAMKIPRLDLCRIMYYAKLFTVAEQLGCSKFLQTLTDDFLAYLKKDPIVAKLSIYDVKRMYSEGKSAQRETSMQKESPEQVKESLKALKSEYVDMQWFAKAIDLIQQEYDGFDEQHAQKDDQDKIQTIMHALSAYMVDIETLLAKVCDQPQAQEAFWVDDSDEGSKGFALDEVKQALRFHKERGVDLKIEALIKTLGTKAPIELLAWLKENIDEQLLMRIDDHGNTIASEALDTRRFDVFNWVLNQEPKTLEVAIGRFGDSTLLQKAIEMIHHNDSLHDSLRPFVALIVEKKPSLVYAPLPQVCDTTVNVMRDNGLTKLVPGHSKDMGEISLASNMFKVPYFVFLIKHAFEWGCEGVLKKLSEEVRHYLEHDCPKTEVARAKNRIDSDVLFHFNVLIDPDFQYCSLGGAEIDGEKIKLEIEGCEVAWVRAHYEAMLDEVNTFDANGLQKGKDAKHKRMYSMLEKELGVPLVAPLECLLAKLKSNGSNSQTEDAASSSDSESEREVLIAAIQDRIRQEPDLLYDHGLFGILARYASKDLIAWIIDEMDKDFLIRMVGGVSFAFLAYALDRKDLVIFATEHDPRCLEVVNYEGRGRNTTLLHHAIIGAGCKEQKIAMLKLMLDKAPEYVSMEVPGAGNAWDVALGCMGELTPGVLKILAEKAPRSMLQQSRSGFKAMGVLVERLSPTDLKAIVDTCAIDALRDISSSTPGANILHCMAQKIGDTQGKEKVGLLGLFEKIAIKFPQLLAQIATYEESAEKFLPLWELIEQYEQFDDAAKQSFKAMLSQLVKKTNNKDAWFENVNMINGSKCSILHLMAKSGLRDLLDMCIGQNNVLWSLEDGAGFSVFSHFARSCAERGPREPADVGDAHPCKTFLMEKQALLTGERIFKWLSDVRSNLQKDLGSSSPDVKEHLDQELSSSGIRRLFHAAFSVKPKLLQTKCGGYATPKALAQSFAKELGEYGPLFVKLVEDEEKAVAKASLGGPQN